MRMLASRALLKKRFSSVTSRSSTLIGPLPSLWMAAPKGAKGGLARIQGAAKSAAFLTERSPRH